MFPCLRFNEQGEKVKSTKILRTIVNEQMLFAEQTNLKFSNLAWFMNDNEVISKVLVNEIEEKLLTSFMKSKNPLRVTHSLEDLW